MQFNYHFFLFACSFSIVRGGLQHLVLFHSFFFFLFAHIIILWVSWWEFLFRFHLPSSSWSSFSVWKRNWVSVRFWSRFSIVLLIEIVLHTLCSTYPSHTRTPAVYTCEKEKVYGNRFNFSTNQISYAIYSDAKVWFAHAKSSRLFAWVCECVCASFSPF